MLAQLDECAFLDLTGISEPGRNSLRLVVEELQVGFQPAAQKIEHTESCRVFEITWTTYISYAVASDSYARVKDYEIYEGRLARVYSKSDFLDDIRRDTFADEKYPGPFKHFCLVCMHHIVDVASASEPRLRLVKRGQPRGVPAA